MQRRVFSRSMLAGSTLGAIGGLTLATPAHAQRIALKEGVEYQRLAQPVPVQTKVGQVEVHEFFAYSCIHCHNFEPVFDAWIKKQPSNVVVLRTPVAFSPDFVPMQRLYYTLEAMGLVDKLHAQVFRAIHEDRQPLHTPPAIVEWAVRQGIDRARFVETFNSRPIGEKCARAVQLQDAYGVEGTPSLGIAGRYYVQGQGPRTVIVADALIVEARKG